MLAGALLIFAATAGAAQASDQLGYVTNERPARSARRSATGTLGTPIQVGSQPVAIAITPDGSMAYVADYGSSEIVPVTLETGNDAEPISLPSRRQRDRDHAQRQARLRRLRQRQRVADHARHRPRRQPHDDPEQLGCDRDLAERHDRIHHRCRPTDAHAFPLALPTAAPIADQPRQRDTRRYRVTPDGSAAYVASNAGDTITPLSLSSDVAGTPIQLGAQPTAIAITPDGSTAYVTDSTSSQAAARSRRSTSRPAFPERRCPSAGIRARSRSCHLAG